MNSFTLAFDNHTCRVALGEDILGDADTVITRCASGGKVLVVSDSNVAAHYAEPVADSLRGAGLECGLAIVAAGEESKSLASVRLLYDKLAALRLGRDGFLIAVGGGMVSDLTGFTAATWLRGVDFVICPTSLEAAVDASIGGKTGVNHAAGKNLIGAFHQPVEVVVDTACLRTLTPRDSRAGLAESIKHALIMDEAFVSWHEAHRSAILSSDPNTIAELIQRNILLKAGIVAEDVRERSGVRAQLNYGHTLGHAIEASCGYTLRHGECVALGMVAAARISRSMGLLREEQCARVEALVRSFGLPVRYDGLAPYDTLASFVAGDKKVASSRVRWVLLSEIGATVLRRDVDEGAIRAAIDSLR